MRFAKFIAFRNLLAVLQLIGYKYKPKCHAIVRCLTKVIIIITITIIIIIVIISIITSFDCVTNEGLII